MAGSTFAGRDCYPLNSEEPTHRPRSCDPEQKLNPKKQDRRERKVIGQIEGPAGLELGQSELFQAFVEQADDLLTVVDCEGRFLWINAAAGRVFGVEPEKCIGRSAFEFVYPEDRSATEQAFRNWVDGGPGEPFSHENRQLCRTGSCLDMLWSVRPLSDTTGKLVGFASSARKITDRVQAEQALHVSEARSRAVMSSVLDPTLTIDSKGVVQEASDSVLGTFGYDARELVGKNISVLMPEPHLSAHDGYLENYRRTGQTNILGRTREFEVVRRDGSMIICELSVARVDVPGEREPLFTGSFRNVTEKRLAQQTLAERERRFSAIFQQEYQYVGLLDTEGRILEMNRAALEAVGLELDDVLGKHFCETPWWSRADADRERANQAILDAARGEFVRFEVELELDQEEKLAIDFSIKPIMNDEGEVILLLPEGRNITAIKRAQQAEKTMLRSLAAIGESAAVLAHEIKNPITAVNLALRAVADQLGEDDQAVLRELSGRMQRLERMMRRTLSFATPLDIEPQPCCATELLATVLSDLKPEVDEAQVELSTHLTDEGLVFRAAPQLMLEVVTNLARNAMQAVGLGGKVVVSATREKGAICFTVEDDGPGISPSERENVFKPFITTKDQGTGLGLPICRKIVEAHGGTIQIGDGALGGARFDVRLPA